MGTAGLRAETFCVDVEETLPSPGPTPGPPPTSAPPPGSLSSSVWNVGSLKKAWYKVDQSTDGPASLSRRLRMISELPKAKDQLRSFNPTDADCLKDLKALGVSSADVRKIAGDYNRGGAQLVDIRATPAAIRAQLRPGAAFTATETGRILIYNAENFWQPDYDHVLGTLLHEFIHFAKNLEDADIQKRLGLTVDGVNTSNISKKLTQDCFK